MKIGNNASKIDRCLAKYEVETCECIDDMAATKKLIQDCQESASSDDKSVSKFIVSIFYEYFKAHST